MIDEAAVLYVESTSRQPLSFDAEKCIGCNICVERCQVDILIPNPQVGRPPIVVYPGECWYDGSCVSACPEPGAITLNRMTEEPVQFRRKLTGEELYV